MSFNAQDAAAKQPQESPESFSDAFSPLAHHLFPDGTPDYITDDAGQELLTDAWPVRTDRTPVTPDSARGSIRSLRLIASERGLTPAEIFVVAVAACATLPHIGRPSGSPLIDGTGRAFADIVRCLVPRPVENSNTPSSSGSTKEERIPAQVVSMLLSATASGRCDARGCAITLRFLTLAVRSGCLRRSREQQRRGARETLSSLYALPFGMLSDAEAVGDAVRLLHAVTRRKHALPHRARRVRALYDEASFRSRNRQSKDGGIKPDAETSSKNIKSGDFAAVLLLLQLYSRYDPVGCGRYFPSGTRLGSSLSRYFKVPDEEWEREFSGNVQPISDGIPSQLSPCLATAEEKEGRARKRDSSKLIGLKRQHPGEEVGKRQKMKEDEMLKQIVMKHGSSSTNEQMRQDKRTSTCFAAEMNMGQSLSATIERLEDAFDGVHSSSWELLHGQSDFATGGNKNGNRAVRASDLLLDKNLRHLILLSSAAESLDVPGGDRSGDGLSNSTLCDSEVARLRVCLPHMLFEEYYGASETSMRDIETEDEDASSIYEGDSDDDISCVASTCTNRKEAGKLRVVQALSSLAKHTDMLPSEAENFILDEILPSWDGSGKIGRIICNDLIPSLKPTSFRDIKKRVLRYLCKLYLCGSPRIKFAIVSGALASLVRRWGRLEWAVQSNKKPSITTTTATTSNVECKQRTLRELIQWTDNLLLGGLIAEASSDGSGHELVRLSALDFYDAVCDICDQCNFVASPTPALIYRLLLSSTALCVDRVCALLLRYKDVFERIKAKSRAPIDAQGIGHDVATNKEIWGLERVALFNCFIWDFCSILWRCSPIPSLNEGQGDSARMNSILFTDIPRETLLALHHLPSDFKVASALSLTHGAVFSGFASDFLDKYYKKRRERGDDCPTSLSADLLTGSVKVKYLDYLKEEGFVHLHGFLITFVGSLAEREKKKTKKRAENIVC